MIWYSLFSELKSCKSVKRKFTMKNELYHFIFVLLQFVVIYFALLCRFNIVASAELERYIDIYIDAILRCVRATFHALEHIVLTATRQHHFSRWQKWNGSFYLDNESNVCHIGIPSFLLLIFPQCNGYYLSTWTTSLWR